MTMLCISAILPLTLIIRVAPPRGTLPTMNVAYERLKAIEEQDRAPKPDVVMPRILEAWGCDAELWAKVRSKGTLIKLANAGDEQTARERIAMLRNAPSVTGVTIALPAELVALGCDEATWAKVRSKRSLITLAAEDKEAARRRIEIVRTSAPSAPAGPRPRGTMPGERPVPTGADAGAPRMGDYALEGALPAGVDADAVAALMARRAAAKRDKDYATADQLQDELISMGIFINDRTRQYFDVANRPVAVPKEENKAPPPPYTVTGKLPAGVRAETVQELLLRRQDCKFRREFDKADEIQKEILAMGVGVNDRTRTFFAGGQGAVREAQRRAAAKDIVDTAVAAGSFKTLAAALGAAGLVETIKSAGPFTVFAPTDDAFAKLPAGTVDDLLKPENKAKLAAILTYHVISGKVMASTVVTMDGQKVKTVNGAEATIKVGMDGVMVDGAKVVTTDIECSNGVIHVIDSVILPA